MKSTVQEIRERFDNDVERFSHLETGNTAQVDSVLSLELIAEAAAAANPAAGSLLDVGCGAGNYTLKILERLPTLNVTLLDLSQPMLQRAVERVTQATRGTVRTVRGDIREVALGEAQFDLIAAAAVLHHLRADREWSDVFAKLYRALKPGGTLWIYDLVQHAMPEIERQMTERYARYLTGIGGEDYRDHVLTYIEQEDTPRPLAWQLEQMRAAGFCEPEVLHKNVSFAAFGARKPERIAQTSRQA
jgi:tRNA (cmo5U34)-methyltransferase